jgi:L-threonylcarbamoyladenylate synthase
MKESCLTTQVISSQDRDSEKIVADCIRGGGVCIIPTDTVYGFSGIVPTSQARIQAIKGRSEGKPFIQLIAEPEELYNYTNLVIPSTLFSLWPGAVTVIVPVKESVGQGTIAFRCPGDSWLRKVISLVGSPIYSTSVNRSGEPVLGTVSSIYEEFSGEVELIVKGDEGIVAPTKPSTLVELLPNTKCKILRQGSVTIPQELIF